MQDAALEPSNVEGVGVRRACTFDFPGAAALAAFVVQRGVGVERLGIAVHHLSPAFCASWRVAGDARRGFEDCLSREHITDEYVRSYNPKYEAVLVLRITVDHDLIVRPALVRFLKP